MELILVSTGSCLFWRIFMVSVITTVGIAQAVWQFSLQMLPYQFLLQGHDKLSNSVLWNSLNDISRFNFLMLLTIWLDRAKILRMRHSCLWKETLMSSRFWLLFAHFTSYFRNKKLSWDIKTVEGLTLASWTCSTFLLASCHLLTRRSSSVVARFFGALVGFYSWIISSVVIYCSKF